MLHLSRIRRNLVWPALATVTSLLCAEYFLRDLGETGWRPWELAAIPVAVAAIALLALPKSSLARTAVLAFTMILAAFFIVYDVVDLLLDPFMAADWPVAAVAATVVWAGVLLVGESDED